MKKYLIALILVLSCFSPAFGQLVIPHTFGPLTGPVPLSYLDDNFKAVFSGMNVRNYSSLNVAIANVGTTPCTLVISTAQTLAASVTVPSTVSLVILRGGSITKISTYTLAINGPFEGCPGCFVGFNAGDITFGLGSVKDMLPDFWKINTSPGTTDMTSAILSASTALLSGMKLNLDNLYAVTPTKMTFTGIVATFPLSGLTDISITGRIKDLNAYAATEAALLFSFSNCHNVNVNLDVTTEAWTVDKRGLNIVQFLQGCSVVNVDLETSGGVAGVWAYRGASDDPTTYTSRLFKVKVKATGIEYPILLQRSGDDFQGQIYAVSSGRAFFIHGVKNIKLDVHTLNPVSQSLISAYGGEGCDNIDVTYYDRDSTVATINAPLVSVQYEDQTPATMRNIKLKFDAFNNVSAPWFYTFSIQKINNIGGYDDVSRGHVLDGLDISGVMENWARPNIINTGLGLFTGSDVIRNINLHDLTISGGNVDLTLGVLDGISTVKNVVSNAGIFMRNGTTGRVVYEAVKATNFSDSTANTDIHTYIGVSQSAPQSIINKTFLDSAITGIKIKEFVRSTDTAPGNISYTGIGFKPSIIHFHAVLQSLNVSSDGWDDKVSPQCNYFPYTGLWNYSSTKSIILTESSGKEIQGVLASLDADGFTITWTATGSPIGYTGVIIATCYR